MDTLLNKPIFRLVAMDEEMVTVWLKKDENPAARLGQLTAD
jgi:hypothetical protein